MRHGATGRRSRNRHGGGGGSGGGHNQNQGGQRPRSGGGYGNNRAQVFDSNGPEVRIRGTAYQICEKYLALARDATSADNRVLAESYYQHAEHYQRIINSWAEEQPVRQERDPALAEQPPVETTHLNVPQPAAQEDDLGLPSSLLAPVRPAELADA